MPKPNARQFIDALRRLEESGDVEALVPLFSETAELGNPHVTASARGREGAREFWRMYRDSFDRIRSEFRAVVEGPDGAMLEWRSAGRTATGTDVTYDGVSVLELGDDGIRRFRAYFDPAELTQTADGKTVAEKKG